MVRRHLRVASLACCALLLQARGTAASDPPLAQSAGAAFQAGRFSAFVVQEDGSALLFSESTSGAALTVAAGRNAEDTPLPMEGAVKDAVAKEDGSWVLLSQLSRDKVILYLYKACRLTPLGEMSGSFEMPALHLAQDGCLWVTSSEGTAYGYRGGKTVTYAFGRDVSARNSHYSYPPMRSLVIPNHGLWFWSLVQNDFYDYYAGPKSATEAFHVYQDGEWRVVPHVGEKLCGAALADPDTIVAATCKNERFRLCVKDGSVTKEDASLPSDTRRTFMHRTQAGRELFMTAPSMHRSPPPPLAPNGGVGRLLARTDGTAQTLLDGVDFRREAYDKGRPVVDVPEGTFIAEAGNGLLFVSADLKTVRRLDWRQGVRLPNITRMILAGRMLHILDPQRGYAAIDYRTLLQARECAEACQWTVLSSASQPVLSPAGSLWYLSSTAAETADLRRCSGSEEERVSLLGSTFSARTFRNLMADSKDRVWLISLAENRYQASLLDKGSWRTFDSAETAFSTLAQEEKDNPQYQIASPSDQCCPSFSGDGRAAYLEQRDRINFFDGVKWLSFGREKKAYGQTLQGQPFYSNKLLTMRAGEFYVQLIDDKWQKAQEPVTPPDESAFSRIAVAALPEGYPGKSPNSLIRLRDNTGTLWIGDADSLWRYSDGLWAPFPAAESPLCLGSSVSSIKVDVSGCIWFALNGGNRTRLARYQPRGAAPVLKWARKPPSVIDSRSYECAVHVTDPNTLSLLKYRVNGGAWQKASPLTSPYNIRVDDLTNGAYSLSVQAHDNLLRASKPLEHAFTVKRDYDREIQQWVKLLASPDFSRREQAVKALAGIGAQALPALLDLEARADASVLWWIRATREEIERQPHAAGSR